MLLSMPTKQALSAWHFASTHSHFYQNCVHDMAPGCYIFLESCSRTAQRLTLRGLKPLNSTRQGCVALRPHCWSLPSCTMLVLPPAAPWSIPELALCSAPLQIHSKFIFDGCRINLHRADRAGRKSNTEKVEGIQSVFKIPWRLVIIKTDRK